MEKLSYSEKLQDIRWKRRRDYIKKRDYYACQACFEHNKPLYVHHRYYEADKDPWDYPDNALVSLCQECHELENEHTREGYERKLLKLFKKNFFVGDLEQLIDGFEKMEMINTSYLIASTLKWIVSDKKRLSLAIHRNIKHIQQSISQKTKENNIVQLSLKGIGENETGNNIKQDTAGDNTWRDNMLKNKGNVL